MRRVALFIVLLAALRCGAQETSRWFVGADFDFYFDNMEAAGCDIDRSGTVFSSRLTPYVGWQWDERNSLTLGVDLRQDFGDSVTFITNAKPVLYYRYRDSRWHVNAGVFPRHLLRGEYGELIFSRKYTYTENQIMGLSGCYSTGRGMIEAAITWDGLHSLERREKFRIFSAGRLDMGKHFFLGYSASMTHLANSAVVGPDEGVVDYIVVDPYAGVRFKAFFDFDLRAHAIFGMQRDRIVGDRRTPVGGQFDFTMSRWGFSFHDNLYLGQNQLPFYPKFETLLYASNEYYGTGHNIYNRAGIDYMRTFYSNTIKLVVSFETHCDGRTVALQQLLSLKINLEKIWK